MVCRTRTFLFSLLLFTFSSLCAQISPEWIRSSPQPDPNFLYYSGIAVDSAGAFYIAARDTRPDSTRVSPVILKFDAMGNPVDEWFLSLNSTGTVFKYHPDGYLYVADEQVEPGTGILAQIWKFDLDGNVLDEFGFVNSFPEYSYPVDFAFLPDGGIYLLVEDDDFLTPKLILVRLDNDLMLKWSVDIFVPTGFSGAGDIISDGGFDVRVLYWDTGTSDLRATLVSVDSSGVIQWTHNTGMDATTILPFMLPDQSVILNGNIVSSDTVVARRYSAGGTALWTRYLIPGGTSALTGAAADANGNCFALMSAPVAPVVADSAHVLMRQIDSLGNLGWLWNFAHPDVRWQVSGLSPVIIGDKVYPTLTRALCPGGAPNGRSGLFFVGVDTATGNQDSYYHLDMPCNHIIRVPGNAISPEGDIIFATEELDASNPIHRYYTGKLCVSGCSIGDAGYTGVSGSIYRDTNGNCTRDAGEIGLEEEWIEILPGPFYTNTDSSGYFEAMLPLGTYTLTHTLKPWYVYPCGTAPLTANLTSVGPVATGLDFAFDIIPARDLAGGLASGPMRPGFDAYVYGWWHNPGTIPLPGSYQLTLDPLLTYISAAPTPDTIAGNVLSWNFPVLAPGGASGVTVLTHVPSGAPLGTFMHQTCVVFPVVGDTLPANNYASGFRNISGSFDPNFKEVSPSDSLTAADSILTYTIHFQNMGTDTAFTVWIRDSIDPDLLPGSLEVVYATHDWQMEVSSGNAVVWRFDGILLPDMFTNEPLSSGYIVYRIKRKPGAPPATFYTNRADIYFDFNLPVSTNTVSSNIRVSVDTDNLISTLPLECFPNPTNGQLNLRWDESLPDEAEIALFDIQGRVICNLSARGHATLELGHLQAGVYLIRVQAGDKYATSRIIKD